MSEMEIVHQELLTGVATRLSKTASATDHLMLTKWRVLSMCQHLLGGPKQDLENACRAALEAFVSHGPGTECDKALETAGGVIRRSKVKELYTFMGMGKKKATEVMAGDICAVVGLEDFNIGDTIADAENPEALPVISVDEPTMSMLFGINNSPFFGKDGKFLLGGNGCGLIRSRATF